MRFPFLLISLLFYLTSYGQSYEFEHVEQFYMPGVKKITVKPFNACCVKEGIRTVYYLNEEGFAVRSKTYYKYKRLGGARYNYDKNGRLAEIRPYSKRKKKNTKTHRFVYSYDSENRLVSKTEFWSVWHLDLKFQDFDSSNNAQTVIRTYNKDTSTIKRIFDAQNRVVNIKRFKDDTLNYEEEIQYNKFNDQTYSHEPFLLDKETGKMVFLFGGNRHAVKETYEYVYDDENRRIEKYVLFDDKKVLLEKRAYK